MFVVMGRCGRARGARLVGEWADIVIVDGGVRLSGCGGVASVVLGREEEKGAYALWHVSRRQAKEAAKVCDCVGVAA